ncbi:MAG: hypothetical protein ACRBB6_04415 [Neptuniibacter sp.]
MPTPLIVSLEREKMGVFGACDTCEIALKEAIDNLPDSPSGLVTAAVMRYHNTLINEILQRIREESHG